MTEYGDHKIIDFLEPRFRKDIRDVFVQLNPRGFEGVSAEEMGEGLMNAFGESINEEGIGVKEPDVVWKTRVSSAMLDFTLWLIKELDGKVERKKVMEFVNNFWEPIQDEYIIGPNMRPRR